MRRRRGRERDEELCSGPGKLTEALGVGLADNGASLDAPPFAVLPRDGAWRGGRGDDRAADRDQQGDREPVALLRRRQPLRLPALARRRGGLSARRLAGGDAAGAVAAPPPLGGAGAGADCWGAGAAWELPPPPPPPPPSPEELSVEGAGAE